MPTSEYQIIKEAQENYGETGIETLLDALEAFYLSGSPDEASGDVEAPTGHFYRIDRWIVVTNNQGFKDVQEYGNAETAEWEFGKLEDDYCEWADEDESF